MKTLFEKSNNTNRKNTHNSHKSSMPPQKSLPYSNDRKKKRRKFIMKPPTKATKHNKKQILYNRHTYTILYIASTYTLTDPSK